MLIQIVEEEMVFKRPMLVLGFMDMTYNYAEFVNEHMYRVFHKHCVDSVSLLKCFWDYKLDNEYFDIFGMIHHVDLN